jgi:hypothetical protein
VYSTTLFFRLNSEQTVVVEVEADDWYSKGAGQVARSVHEASSVGLDIPKTAVKTVGFTTTCVSKTHVVKATQTVLALTVGNVTIHWFPVVHFETEVQMRSEVKVRGVLSND